MPNQCLSDRSFNYTSCRGDCTGHTDPNYGYRNTFDSQAAVSALSSVSISFGPIYECQRCLNRFTQSFLFRVKVFNFKYKY